MGLSYGKVRYEVCKHFGLTWFSALIDHKIWFDPHLNHEHIELELIPHHSRGLFVSLFEYTWTFTSLVGKESEPLDESLMEPPLAATTLTKTFQSMLIRAAQCLWGIVDDFSYSAAPAQPNSLDVVWLFHRLRMWPLIESLQKSPQPSAEIL